MPRSSLEIGITENVRQVEEGNFPEVDRLNMPEEVSCLLLSFHTGHRNSLLALYSCLNEEERKQFNARVLELQVF